MSLVSVQDVKSFCGVSGEIDDAEMDRLIAVVESSVEQWCGRAITRNTSATEYFSVGRGGDPAPTHLRVARPPVRSITSIHDDPTRVYGAGTLLSASSYVLLDPSAGIVVFDGYTPQKGLQNLRIVYDGGFAPDDAAVQPLRQVIIEQAWLLREKGINNMIGVRSRSVADGSVQYVNLDLSSEQERILSRYRLDVVHGCL